MQRLRIDVPLTFGKHKGKTIVQIYSGITDISEQDKSQLYAAFGDDLMPNGKLSFLYDLVGREAIEELGPEVGIRLKYLPDPGYIDEWLIHKSENIVVAPEDLETLEGLEICTLVRLKSNGDTDVVTLIPGFVKQYRKFSPATFAAAKSKFSKLG